MSEFKRDLLVHLSEKIIVKESRMRYQDEQFSRFLTTLDNFMIGRRGQSLDNFCVNYAATIEAEIERSHNYKSPAIRANYDTYEEE